MTISSFPSTDRIRSQRGSEESPGVQVIDNAGTGIFFPEEGGIALADNGTEVARFGSGGQLSISDGDFEWTEGVLSLTGDINLRNRGSLLLSDADSSSYVGFKAPETISSNLVWVLPAADGTNGQVLKTDGSGSLSWANNLSGSSTPGGSNTNVQFNDGGAFGGDADLTWDKTNNVLGVTGNVDLKARGSLLFSDTDSSNYVGFRAPATISTNLVWVLPSADGTSGQVLSTNGSGTLSWATGGGGGGGGQEYYYSSTPPGSPSPGAEWVDSDTGKLYTYDDDGDSSQWVEFGAPGVGTQGPAGTLTIGTVTTGAAGSSATVTNVGTSSNAILDFSIPRGDKGDTGPTGAKSVTVLNPSAPDRIGILFTTTSQTISRIQSVVTGSGSPSVSYSLNYGTDFSATGTAVVTAGITANSTTSGVSTTSFNNATVPSNNYLYVLVNSISGTVTSLHISITFA